MAITITYPVGQSDSFALWALGEKTYYYFNFTDITTETGIRAKVEILDASSNTLLTTYHSHYANNGSSLFFYRVNIADLLADLIPEIEMPDYTDAYLDSNTRGRLAYKVKVSSISSATAQTSTQPTTGAFYVINTIDDDFLFDDFRFLSNTPKNEIIAGARRFRLYWSGETTNETALVMYLTPKNGILPPKYLTNSQGNPIFQAVLPSFYDIPINDNSLGVPMDSLSKIELRLTGFNPIGIDPTEGMILGFSLDSETTNTIITHSGDNDYPVGSVVHIEAQEGSSDTHYEGYFVVEAEDAGNDQFLISTIFDPSSDPDEYSITEILYPAITESSTPGQTGNYYHVFKVMTIGNCTKRTLHFFNENAGFDAIDFVENSSERFSEAQRLYLTTGKQRHNVRTATRRNLTGVNAYGKADTIKQMMKSTKHYIDDEKVLLLTDSAMLDQRHEFTELEIDVENDDD